MGLVIRAKPRVEREDLEKDRRFNTRTIEWEHVDCVLCGGRDFVNVVESPDFTTKPGGLFQVVRCRDCGLAFTNPRPTMANIGQFYAPDYAPHEGHAWDESWRGRLRRRVEHAVLRCHFNYPPQPADRRAQALAMFGRIWIRRSRRRAAWIPFCGSGRLLDFGCGAAQFARLMRSYGWTVEGVDVSAAVSEKVERNIGIRVHVGTLPHPDIWPASFDAVTMWESLEHVHEPRVVVRGARELLLPGGILLVCVPNIESWSFRKFGKAWYGLELPRHLVHFSPSTLCELLRREGFRVRAIEQIGRDGWLRRSVRRSAQTGQRSWRVRSLNWKPLALAASRWTEHRGRADCMLALAERD